MISRGETHSDRAVWGNPSVRCLKAYSHSAKVDILLSFFYIILDKVANTTVADFGLKLKTSHSYILVRVIHTHGNLT